MKSRVKALLIWGLILGLFVGVPSWAAENPPGPWQNYLSPTEQAALAELAKRPDSEQSGSKEDDKSTPQETLRMLREGYAQFVTSNAPRLESVKVEPFEEDGIKGLWLRPEGVGEERVLLYFHGGGYVVGSAATGVGIAGTLAKEAGIVAFSLDYPLAPEFPYPAALDNAVAAYRMLMDKVGAANVVLAGDSAGGGLTLAVLLRVREMGLPMPAGAYLLSPWTDLGVGFASHQVKRETDTLVDKVFLENLADAYVGKLDRKEPLISPAFADLRGLPPLLVHVGSYETLLDDALAVVRNAALADVPVKLTVWPGYQHVFQMLPQKLEGAHKALQDGAGFLKDVLSGRLLRPGEGTIF